MGAALWYLTGTILGLWLGPRAILAGLARTEAAPVPPARALAQLGRRRRYAAVGATRPLVLARRAALLTVGLVLTTTPWHLGPLMAFAF